MLRLVLALLILASLPAAADAAPFGELPSLPVKDPARCLRATGAPGEVVRWAPDGADVVQATASGFGAPVHIKLGDRFGECPIAAAQPSGAAVVIQRLDEGIGVAIRDPGGAFAPMQTLGAHDFSDENPVAAVTPGGDVVVAWTDVEHVNDESNAHVLLARRPAGGTFGAPVELTPLKRYLLVPPQVVLGMQDDGTVIALWSEENPNGSIEGGRVRVAVAPPGAPFGPAQLLSTKLRLGDFSVTVAPDGRALALVDEPGHVRLLERPPGGAFARVADLGYTETLFGPVGIALRPDGAAIVAWMLPLDGRVYALRRDGPGPFRRELVAQRPKHPYGPELADFDGGAPAEDDGRALHAAFTPDGRAMLAWAPAHTLGNLDWTAATIATFPGGVQTLSGPARDADSITPVILADGTPAVAWSDVADGGAPRLHLAIEGAPAAPPPPAPRVEIGRVQQIHQGLSVPFRCSAACDLRAAVPDRVFGRRSLRAAGSGRLKILPDYDPILLRRADSVRVEVVSGAPGARTTARRTVTAKLRVPPVPPLLGVTAVRTGKTHVMVRWHTDRPLRHASIVAVASDRRAPADPFFGSVVKGRGRSAFHLRVEAFSGDRYVQLFLVYEPDATERRIALVRITK